MKFYQEISLLPNADISVYFIWQKLYQQIHLALADNKEAANRSSIGVSFPEYNADQFSLGTKLRIFAGNEELLKKAQFEKWLVRLSDYAHVSPIKEVPEDVAGHACFRHVKLKGNKEKLARRRAKRKGETLQQALAHFDGYQEQHSKLPYINMTSQTNVQRFRLFIEKIEKEQPQTGTFSCYGLSDSAIVPLF